MLASDCPSLTTPLTAASTGPVRLLIAELEDVLSAEYPPENRYGLPLEAIFQPHVRFFVSTLDGAPGGCGGVALLAGSAEAERMYVRPDALRPYRRYGLTGCAPFGDYTVPPAHAISAAARCT